MYGDLFRRKAFLPFVTVSMLIIRPRFDSAQGNVAILV